jgi:hypothetical protein
LRGAARTAGLRHGFRSGLEEKNAKHIEAKGAPVVFEKVKIEYLIPATLVVLAQQTASTQWLLAQSAAAVQGWPFDFLPQLPLWHTRPATQSLSLAQRLMHAPSAHL